MTTLEGDLLKDGGWRRGWRKRYFKLTKIYFQYYENDFSTSPKGAAVRGTVQNVEVIDLKTFHFRVTFRSETWDLQASTTHELIKWMEAIKPNSAASVIKSQQITTSPQPQSRATLPNQSVTAIEPENSEPAYQQLPQSFTVNPRFSVGSDGRSSPSTSASPRVRQIHPQMDRVQSEPNDYRTVSNSSVRSQSSTHSSSPARSNVNSPQLRPQTHEERRSLPPAECPAKPAVSARQSLPASFTPSLPLYTLDSRRRMSCEVPVAEAPYEDPESVSNQERPGQLNLSQQNPAQPPLDLDFSDDEFLDFGDDDAGTYMNDPKETLNTLRKEVRSLRLSDTSATVVERDAGGDTPVNPPTPVVYVIPDTPERTLKENYSNAAAALIPQSVGIPSQYSEIQGNVLLEKPEYANDPNQSIESDASPVPLRRSIKSQKVAGNVNYSITVPTPLSEDDSEEHLPKMITQTSIKSTTPVTNDHSLHRDDSTTSFLSASAPSPTNRITTLRVQEWVKNVQPVRKAFVDPEDQELGALDKFLIDNATCLPKENFTLLQKIGNGAFGEVWNARCSTSVNGDDMVAVKCLKEGASDKHRHDFYGEAALLGQFKHPNVIALHGVILQESSPWIVIEYAENGALKSFIKKHGDNRHSHQLLNYCRDIVRGMRYLSERGFIHRDLAARNVLLTRMEVCKVADFGLSRKLGDDDDIYVSRGGMVAIKWTAPEGVLGASYSSASDVWSCGITMWEVFSDGANPWSGQSNEDAFRLIRRGGRLSKPEKCPLDVYKTMLQCWLANPLDRPSFGELDRLLYDPDTENVEQPLYENTDGFVQYVNMEYQNMQDVERAS